LSVYAETGFGIPVVVMLLGLMGFWVAEGFVRKERVAADQ
jgi:hypothetical protein